MDLESSSVITRFILTPRRIVIVGQAHVAPVRLPKWTRAWLLLVTLAVAPPVEAHPNRRILLRLTWHIAHVAKIRLGGDAHLVDHNEI